MEDIFGLYLDDDEGARQKALAFAQALRAAKQRQQQSGLWEQVASLGANPVLQGAVGTFGHAAQRAGQEATQYRALLQDAAQARSQNVLRQTLAQRAAEQAGLQREAEAQAKARQAQEERGFQREMLEKKLGSEREAAQRKLELERPEKLTKQTDALREEYGKNPIILNASKVSDAFRSMQRAATQANGPGDVALVYKFITFLDPASSVKEGEIDIAKASQGPAARYLTTWEHVKKGDILSPAARQEMITTAESIIGDRMRTAAEVKGYYGELAKRRGIPQEDVFVPTGVDGAALGSEASDMGDAPKPGGVPVGTVKEWQGRRVRKLPDGSWEEVD